MKKIIITATDTGVGKTASCEWLCNHLSLKGKVQYIKPIQCGPGETIEGIPNSGDAENIRTRNPNITASTLFHLKTPASPHLAFEKEGHRIDSDQVLKKITETISKSKVNIIEGAGGILVPLNRDELFIDLFRKLEIPVIVIIRPGLGTINHSLLTLQTLATQNVPILGFMSAPGDSILFDDNVRCIEEFSKIPFLGKVPHTQSKLFEDSKYFKKVWKQIEQRYQILGFNHNA
ncbi:dethiobiotin synthase [Fibrobacterales bacterium]|nr:dethiobiotin synthase [Fibrobacterales bacterium]